MSTTGIYKTCAGIMRGAGLFLIIAFLIKFSFLSGTSQE